MPCPLDIFADVSAYAVKEAPRSGGDGCFARTRRCAASRAPRRCCAELVPCGEADLPNARSLLSLPLISLSRAFAQLQFALAEDPM